MKHRSFFIARILSLVIVMLIVGCSGSGSKGTSAASTAGGTDADIHFDKVVHDFGQIISGEKVAYAFKFTNTGNGPLIISGIRSGCGCTVGDYPKGLVAPGEGGRINVVFNSTGRNGFQTESVNVLTNVSNAPITLRITAEVISQ